MSIELRALGAAVLAGLFVVVLALTVAKLAAPTITVTPVTAPSATKSSGEVAQGGIYFQNTCAGCHGSNAQGGSGAPSLHKEDMSDDEIMTIIKTGEGRMPSFDKIYTAKQIHSITAYIRTLN